MIVIEFDMNKLITSDIPVLMGQSSYKSPFTLFHEKKENVEKQDDTFYKTLRKHIFELIAKIYTEETGKDIQITYPETNFHTQRFYLCDPDAMIVESGKLIKPVKFEFFNFIDSQEIENGSIPLSTMLEIQAQIASFKLSEMDLACIYKNSKFAIINIEKNDQLIKEIEKAFDEFHIFLTNDTPPPVDYQDSTKQCLNKLYPEDNGETIELSKEAIEEGIKLEKIKKQIKELTEKDKTLCENIIKKCIGDNTFGRCDQFTYSWKTTSRKGYIKIDTSNDIVEKLKSENIPFKIVEPTRYKTLNYSENKK